MKNYHFATANIIDTFGFWVTLRTIFDRLTCDTDRTVTCKKDFMTIKLAIIIKIRVNLPSNNNNK